jgi:hypothetical protein
VIDLTHLKDYAWETEYLGQISGLIPDIEGVAIHWRSERLFRRWFPRLRSKFLRTRLRVPRNVDGNTVLIILSDELYRVPPPLHALAVFKQYAAIEDRISIPFPLGFQRGFPAIAPQPIRKRPIDVGFLGRMYPHRKAFLIELSNHPRLRPFRLDLTSERRVSVPEYSAFLNEAKISLCLPGNYSPETFRFYESMKIGCIPVSAKMPDNGLYRSHPGFPVDDFNDVNHVAAVLQSILEAPEQFESLQQRSLQAWESHYSPAAVAARIKDVVASRITASSSQGNS